MTEELGVRNDKKTRCDITSLCVTSSYASHTLSNWGRRVFLKLKGETVAVISGMATRKTMRYYNTDKELDTLNKLYQYLIL